ncbi:MAG TPA: MXAN_5808 family serine peptidase, partial [Polyangiaceae bacterium]|nr:MXAN_5808 family serine peptidase [Polyangiaceae bacterium]
QLKVVNEVLRIIREKYVDPKRVKPKEMLLSSLNAVQRDVAQIIVLHEEGAATVKVRVDTQEKEFRVDNVQGPWDVSARLREIFAFLQDGLRGTEVDLREVEYAACNGMLHTLDPHSVLLSPEAYKDMNLSTSGQFGGLGIVISLRDQQLTVINPMPGTPASRAGLKRYDRILKIDAESTLNMGLNEAVNHLRGTPGSKVTIWVHRDGPEGWSGTRPFELTRETIHVASVEHKLLDGNVGYVRIKQFQQNTSSDLDKALEEMKQNGQLKGLVLDLRGNPGGLLDQAVKIADKFLTTGPIVATVGNSEGRDEKSAHADGTEPNYPIALLVNGSSASASEIVSGAMKNHDRAVLIGETTFGKGSVQLVFNDLPDKAALKLTIAQYLTEPGDISIQGTGVTPDIELDPMTVDTLEMDLAVDGGTLKERDLSRSLSNARAHEGQHPTETLRYYLSQKDRQELRERGGDPDDNFTMDFPIKFARDLVTRVPQGPRPDQVRAAKPLIGEARAAELTKVAADLQKMGVDWSDAPSSSAAGDAPQTAPPLEVKLETDRPSNEVNAGDPMNLKVTVTNKGTVPLYRLFATTKSDNGMFENKELVIGKLDPGKSKTATTPLGWCDVEGHKVGSTAPLPKDAPRVCKIPRDALTRADGIKLHFEEARSTLSFPEPDIRVTTKALERPTFSYSYEIIDNRKGNGDGRLQKGEEMTMYLTVRNTGKGRSFDAQANLRNLSGSGLLLRDGRFNDVSNMNPGDERKVAFTFDVQPELTDPEAKLELSIVDQDLRESVAEKVHIPIASPAAITAKTQGMKAGPQGAQLFASPDASVRAFGKLVPGAAVNVTGDAGQYLKVSLSPTRFAFVKASDMVAGGGAPATVAFQDVMLHAPPALEIAPLDLATRENHVHLKATASDGDRLLDAYTFVGARKVFYRSNRNGADPRKMDFETDLPLRPGTNAVVVWARETPDTTTRKVFIVRKDGPNGELLPTPKTDDDIAENAGGSDD